MTHAAKKRAPTLRRSHLLISTAVACAIASFNASAQTSFAAGTEVVLPLAANVGIYHSQVFVRNPNASAITLNVRYYQSNNGTAPSGLRSCSQLVLQGDQTQSFDLGTQCGLTGTDDDFGMIVLSDVAGTNRFFAYSRTQTPDGLGFSVEGFPTENFSGSPSTVLGLQTLAAAPNYKSNCFVAALGQPVNWHIDLVQSGTETVLGSTISGSLQAFETTRVLDVFNAAGLVGDYSNISAHFSTPDNPAPPFVGFCTLETTSNGSADFRIAKNVDQPSNGGGGGTPTLKAAWHLDTIQTLSNLVTDFQFTGSTTVTLGSTSTLSAYGGGWFARSSAGSTTGSLNVCYQDQNGPGPITTMGTTTVFSIGNTASYHSATGSATVSAGTYAVGLCAKITGTAANKNGGSAGFVFTLP
jgi:hypothetical protein